MTISKRIIAREWLFILSLLATGFLGTYFLCYSTGWTEAPGRDFWNDLHSRYPIVQGVWLRIVAPYLVVTLARSVWWAAKVLRD